jgi:small-conductance mechanosensitive channel/CRP-like cAMP-binding protein
VKPTLPLHLVPTALAEAGTYHFNPQQWSPSSADAIRLLYVAPIVLIACLLACFFARHFLRRAKLVGTALLASSALTFYVAASAIEPDRMDDLHDYLSLWFTRLVAATLLLCLLRAVDRLLILPVLSRGEKAPANRILYQIVKTVLFLLAIWAFGAIAFNWDIDRFLAGSAVVSIVVGLALQQTLGNFFSGLVIQASRPLSLGDWIVIGDSQGRVVDMSWRAITLLTTAGNHVIVPNGLVASERLTNFSVPTQLSQRFIDVDQDDRIPPADVTPLLEEAARETAGVLAEPPVTVLLSGFPANNITYRVQFWIDEPAAFATIEHRVRTNIWYRLKQKPFALPPRATVLESIDRTAEQQKEQHAAVARRRAALDQAALLAPLSEAQKESLAQSAAEMRLAQGQVLFRQDQPGESLFLICAGEVEVLASSGDGRASSGDGRASTRVATLGPGEVFGEMSALTGQPRTATVRALGSLRYIEISKTDLASVFATDPGLMEKISVLIADRNAERNAALRDLTSAAPTPEATARVTLLRRMRGFFAGAGS